MRAPSFPISRREYRRLMASEKAYFSRLHESGGASPIMWENSGWHERMARLYRSALGRDLDDFIAREAAKRGRPRLASLGSGTAVREAALARRLPRGSRFECVDINSEGVRAARRRGVPLRARLGDLNFLDLPARSYDVILCFHILHHVVALERLFETVRRALRPGGLFITEDVCTPDRLRPRPETREAFEGLWRAFRRGPLPELENTIGFEGVRSSAIVPLLGKEFRILRFVPLSAFAWRLNALQVDDPLLLRTAWGLDRQWLRKRVLKPEVFAAVMSAGEGPHDSYAVWLLEDWDRVPEPAGIPARVRRLAGEGDRRVVLYGARTTGEIVYRSCAGAGVEVVAAVDSDRLLHGKKLCGEATICAPGRIASFKPDAVWICSRGGAEEIFVSLRGLAGKGIRVRRIFE